jgi:hypothetical protein
MSGTVYIVGAGASYQDTIGLDTPLPLAIDFFRPCYLEKHWQSWYGPFQKSALATILRQYFGYTRTVHRPIHIEEVYSFVDIVYELYGNVAHDPEQMNAARRELLQYIHNVITSSAWNHGEAAFHNWVVDTLRDRDSILCFNWDLLFDEALCRTKLGKQFLARQMSMLEPPHPGAGDPPTEDLMLAHERAGHFLKLHGSVNLAVCKNIACRRAQFPYRLGIREPSVVGLECLECGSPLEVFLVPPHVQKSYRGSRLSRLQASTAARHLNSAARIVIVGYSLPLLDFEAACMFRAARLNPDEVGWSDHMLLEVAIVDPKANDPAYKARVHDLFGLGKKRYYGHVVPLRTFGSIAEYIEKGGAS